MEGGVKMTLSTEEIYQLPQDGRLHTIEKSLHAKTGRSGKQSTRIIGKTRIPYRGRGHQSYEVALGIWGKDYFRKEEIIVEWEKRKSWAIANNCRVTNYGKRADNKAKSLEYIFKKYIAENPKLNNPYSLYNTENRLNQILNLLPDGALVNEFSGEMGRKKIYRYVIEPKENEGKNTTAKRYRGLLRQVFIWAFNKCLLDDASFLPSLDRPFPFEDRIVEKKRPHLKWIDFKSEFIPDLNKAKNDDLVGLSVKASLLMLSRVSSIVRLEWNWLKEVDGIKCFEIPPETKGVKRKYKKIMDQSAIPHHVPITSEMDIILQKLKKITGYQKYVFWSPNSKGHLCEETPNGRLRDMGYRGRQCIHGFRHVATTAGGDLKGINRQIISKTIGQLDQSGSIANYDESLRLMERKEVLEWWNKQLITEGLKI